jgi:hypothetical protein
MTLNPTLGEDAAALVSELLFEAEGSSRAADWANGWTYRVAAEAVSGCDGPIANSGNTGDDDDSEEQPATRGRAARPPPTPGFNSDDSDDDGVDDADGFLKSPTRVAYEESSDTCLGIDFVARCLLSITPHPLTHTHTHTHTHFFFFFFYFSVQL